MFGNKKGLERKLRENGGTIAWATILEADEKWRTARGGDTGFGGPSQITDHMKVKLRVEPDGQPTFEAEINQAFPGLTPHAGGRAQVIYDPADHSKIAILEGEVYIPGLSVEKQQRTRARAAAARSAAESGHLAEFIEQRQAEAMQSVAGLGGTAFAMPTGAEAKPNVVDQIAKLADLRDRGALTDAEFQAQKEKLLGAG